MAQSCASFIRFSSIVRVFLPLVAAVLLLSSGALTADGKKPKEEFNLQKILVHHLMDAPIIEWNYGGTKIRPGVKEYQDPQYIRRYAFHDQQGEYKWHGGLPLHITKRTAMMFIVSFILCAVMIAAARFISGNPYKVKNRFAGMIEALVQYLRNEVVDANMHHAQGFLPYMLTLFFFILFSNLLGLVPPLGEIAHTIVTYAGGHHETGDHHAVPMIMLFWPGITVTGDIAVTLTLASITTALIWITGFRYQGFRFLLSCMPSGMPWYLYWLFLLLFPLELVIGPLAKGFALMIRLLANMTAGHVMIIALLGFIFQFPKLWYFIPAISVGGAGAIYMLEVLIAFLQAYVFVLLTALFIGSSMHSH